MKKVIFMGVLGLFLLGSCNSKSGDSHEGHNHETEEHNHDGHDHEGHDHEHEGHNHEHEEQENHAGGSDEIILPPAKAQAAGVAVSTVEPGSFHQVIKTSGQVMAAQGDESVAVATVAGVVSFKGKVIEGMSVSKGTPLVVLSSKNMADGDPVQKARIAYEVSKKEYERMKALVGNKIVSEKEFAQAEQIYENARISYEAVAKNHSAIGQNITAPIRRLREKYSGERRGLCHNWPAIGQRDTEPPSCSSVPKCRKSITRISAQLIPPISGHHIIIRYMNWEH